MTLATGQVLQSRYRIVSLLGQGGFGAVYRAWDMNLNKPVAVKENRDTSADAQRQFRREAQILANLSHPNLPRVTDHFLIPDMGQYLVMDFVEGGDLQALLDEARRPLPETQITAWIGQVCDALIYLHSQTPPIIHRDIKPANIKITPQGRAVLVDFGISKVYDSRLRTTIGAQAVTPGYLPLEQYGEGTTDTRSDIYALGATLYVLLTGQEPQASVQRVLDDQVRAPHEVNPLIAPTVGETIQRAMSINPTQRYQAVDEMKTALGVRPSSPLSPEQQLTPPPPMFELRPSQRIRRRMRVIGGILLAVAGLTAIAGIVLTNEIRLQLPTTATMSDFGNGNFALGLGLGIEAGILALMACLPQRPRWMDVASVLLMMAATAALILGVLTASAAAAEKALPVLANVFGNGNFVLGLGSGVGVSGLMSLAGTVGSRKR